MKSIYITSVDRFAGKTATCLALGRHFQAWDYQVGYLKPVSYQPYRIGEHIADEDAVFVKKVLNLDLELWEMSPVVVTSEFLRLRLTNEHPVDLMAQIKAAFHSSLGNNDLMMLEGGTTLRDGFALNIEAASIAHELGSHVLTIIRYHSDAQLLDDIMACKQRLGDSLMGILINRVNHEHMEFIRGQIGPYLEQIGIPLFGVLPEVASLSAITVGELIDTLHAEVLTRYRNPNALVENFTIGAMTQEAALSRFRKQSHKAVVTGGDRTDIQLAALETSTTCLILTGNLRPSPLVVRQAEDFGVSILLVPLHTMETIERIDTIFGKSNLGQEEKLHAFEKLMEEHFDFQRLASSLQLEKVS